MHQSIKMATTTNNLNNNTKIQILNQNRKSELHSKREMITSRILGQSSANSRQNYNNNQNQTMKKALETNNLDTNQTYNIFTFSKKEPLTRDYQYIDDFDNDTETKLNSFLKSEHYEPLPIPIPNINNDLFFNSNYHEQREPRRFTSPNILSTNRVVTNFNQFEPISKVSSMSLVKIPATTTTTTTTNKTTPTKTTAASAAAIKLSTTTTLSPATAIRTSTGNKSIKSNIKTNTTPRKSIREIAIAQLKLTPTFSSPAPLTNSITKSNRANQSNLKQKKKTKNHLKESESQNNLDTNNNNNNYKNMINNKYCNIKNTKNYNNTQNYNKNDMEQTKRLSVKSKIQNNNLSPACGTNPTESKTKICEQTNNQNDENDNDSENQKPEIPEVLRKQGTDSYCSSHADNTCPCNTMLDVGEISEQITYCDRKTWISLERMHELRKRAQEALKNNHTFTIRGCFFSVRNALVSRGWVEKLDIHRKNIPSGICQITYEDLTHNLPKRRTGESRRQYLIKCERNIMSRFLEHMPIHFLWTARKEKCDYVDQAKNPALLINKFHRVPFTSKEGLCNQLKDFHWFYEEGTSELYFPRCYNVWSPEELTDFIENFRITACIGYLRYLVYRYRQNNGYENCFLVNSKIPFTSIEFAIKRCNEYIDMCCHNDIDVHTDNIRIWEHDWDVFYSHHHLFTNENVKILPDVNGRLMNIEATIQESEKVLSLMTKYWPQYNLDGYYNLWIVKPANKCRGRGIHLLDNLKRIMTIINPAITTKSRYVVQKYIERPLIIHNTKFDVRQWFLLTSAQPMVIWMYKESYLRFSSQEYNLSNHHESVHLTNHAIQKKYRNGKRDKRLPNENMWDSISFQAHLRQIGEQDMWEDRIYPGMRRAIIGSMLASQENMDRRTNTFELFGADFMISEDFYPWLIEINSSPDLGGTTSVTARMCPQCLEDVIKVVIDKRCDPKADTGNFEMIYRQNIPPAPAYMGLNLFLRGKQLLATKSGGNNSNNNHRLKERSMSSLSSTSRQTMPIVNLQQQNNATTSTTTTTNDNSFCDVTTANYNNYNNVKASVNNNNQNHINNYLINQSNICEKPMSMDEVGYNFNFKSITTTSLASNLDQSSSNSLRSSSEHKLVLPLRKSCLMKFNTNNNLIRQQQTPPTPSDIIHNNHTKLLNYTDYHNSNNSQLYSTSLVNQPLPPQTQSHYTTTPTRTRTPMIISPRASFLGNRRRSNDTNTINWRHLNETFHNNNNCNNNNIDNKRRSLTSNQLLTTSAKRHFSCGPRLAANITTTTTNTAIVTAITTTATTINTDTVNYQIQQPNCNPDDTTIMQDVHENINTLNMINPVVSIHNQEFNSNQIDTSTTSTSTSTSTTSTSTTTSPVNLLPINNSELTATATATSCRKNLYEMLYKSKSAGRIQNRPIKSTTVTTYTINKCQLSTSESINLNNNNNGNAATAIAATTLLSYRKNCLLNKKNNNIDNSSSSISTTTNNNNLNLNYCRRSIHVDKLSAAAAVAGGTANTILTSITTNGSINTNIKDRQSLRAWRSKQLGIINMKNNGNHCGGNINNNSKLFKINGTCKSAPLIKQKHQVSEFNTE